VAQHYRAICLFELGKTEEAISSLQDLSRSSDKNTAAMTKLSLAGFHRKLGQREQAAQLLQELADNPTVTVPRATALLELATLKSYDDPAEARRLYNEIKTEFADTPVRATPPGVVPCPSPRHALSALRHAGRADGGPPLPRAVPSLP
jgi:tetratricopeptide (TPR) repeat protein